MQLESAPAAPRTRAHLAGVAWLGVREHVRHRRQVVRGREAGAGAEQKRARARGREVYGRGGREVDSHGGRAKAERRERGGRHEPAAAEQRGARARRASERRRVEREAWRETLWHIYIYIFFSRLFFSPAAAHRVRRRGAAAHADVTDPPAPTPTRQACNNKKKRHWPAAVVDAAMPSG